jgi:hypothetical protein
MMILQFSTSLFRYCFHAIAANNNRLVFYLLTAPFFFGLRREKNASKNLLRTSNTVSQFSRAGGRTPKQKQRAEDTKTSTYV